MSSHRPGPEDRRKVIESVAGMVTHPERLAILRHLRPEGSELTVNHCVDLDPPVDPSMAGYHLRALISAGAVEWHDFRRIDGGRKRKRVFRLDRDDKTGRAVADLIDICDGVVTVAGGESKKKTSAKRRKLRDPDVVKIGKALGHPTRIALLRAYGDGRVQSVVSWWKENRDYGSLSGVNFHYESLVECQLMTVRDTRPRRGTIEHFYRLQGQVAARAVEVLDALEGNRELIALQ